MLETYSRRALTADTTTDSASHDDVHVPCIMLRCVQTLDLPALCGVDYPWLSDTNTADQSIRTWEERVLRQPFRTVLELRCDHFSPFEAEHVSNTLSLSLSWFLDCAGAVCM